MNFDKYLNNIQRQFNYDKEMMNVISLAFKGLVNYYGSYGHYFNKIYELFMTTRICGYNIPDGSTLGNRTEEKEKLMRLYSDKSEEEIAGNQLNEAGELLHKVVDDRVIKTVIVRKDGGIIHLDTLVHELIHGLVTSSVVQEENGSTFIKSGMSYKYLTPVDYVTNHSIEEGFTEYDTMMVCRSIGYNVDPSDRYYYLYDYAATIMDDEYINKLITRSRLDGTNYISLEKNDYFKDTLTSYINNFESISYNKNYLERFELIAMNKERVRNILNQKSR